MHDSEEQLHTTLFDIVVNRAVAGVGARHLPGASESERSGSAKCILRMSKWADMAKAVVEAEFPYFLVVIAFSVFALADGEKAVA